MNEDAVPDLVRTAQAGSVEAFTRLVDRTRGLVAAMVGGDEDLVQDVFLQAWRRLGSLREPRAFKGWLVRLALNEVRGQARRRTVERRALPRLARDRTSKPSVELAERAEQRTRLLAALEDLPPETRAIVTLRYLEGQRAPEIARALDLRPDAVRQRLSRALRTLRSRLT